MIEQLAIILQQAVTALPMELIEFTAWRIAEFFLVSFIPLLFFLIFRMGVNTGKRQMLTELELRRIAAELEKEADSDEQ